MMQTGSKYVGEMLLQFEEYEAFIFLTPNPNPTFNHQIILPGSKYCHCCKTEKYHSCLLYTSDAADDC